MGSIIVTSGYGANTKRPFVQIESEVLDRPLQLSVEEARELSRNLLEAAEAAESDGFLVGFLKEIEPEITTIQQAEVLFMYRKYRDNKKIGS